MSSSSGGPARDSGAAAFVVREATAADLDAVERLIAAFQAEGDWRRDPPIHAATRAAITEGRAAGVRTFLAESVVDAAGDAGGVGGAVHAAGGVARAAPRGTAVAFASTWFAWDLGDGPGTWLSDLFVDPAWRRRGVGRALMAAVARSARADGAEWMGWHVHRENPRAQAFYAALGAEPKPQHLAMGFGGAAIERLCG